MSDTKRIAYLDVAKGIGMLLVVMGHVEYIDIGLRQFITVFHMPLFFLISGILLEEKKEENKAFAGLFKRKLQRIMVPYAVFSMLSFLLESFRILIKDLDQWNVVLRQLFQSCCLQGVSTLWFLPALFISEMLFIGIRKKASHVGTIVITMLLVIVCSMGNQYEQLFYEYHAVSRQYRLLHDVCSMVIRNTFCIGFVCAGYYVNKYFLKITKSYSRNFFGLIICSILALLLISNAGGADLRFMEFGFLPIYLTAAVMGSVTVILFSRFLEYLPIMPIRKMAEYYGKNSLIIMVTHLDFRVLYISILISQVVLKLQPVGDKFGLVVIVLVFMLEVPMIWFINRYLPFTLGKRKKSS